VWERIQPIIRQTLAKPASSRATQAPILVEVWNGTPYRDRDRLAADRLAHMGFVPIVAQADRRDYARTQLIFYGSTPKGTGLEAVQRTFNVWGEDLMYQENPDSEVKMRLIIGQNYQTCW
jgi:hypothetical protein